MSCVDSAHFFRKNPMKNRFFEIVRIFSKREYQFGEVTSFWNLEPSRRANDTCDLASLVGRGVRPVVRFNARCIRLLAIDTERPFWYQKAVDFAGGSWTIHSLGSLCFATWSSHAGLATPAAYFFCMHCARLEMVSRRAQTPDLEGSPHMPDLDRNRRPVSSDLAHFDGQPPTSAANVFRV